METLKKIQTNLILLNICPSTRENSNFGKYGNKFIVCKISIQTFGAYLLKRWNPSKILGEV